MQRVKGCRGPRGAESEGLQGIKECKWWKGKRLRGIGVKCCREYRALWGVGCRGSRDAGGKISN